MLDAISLRRRYGELRAVDDVSFTVGQGEIVGLLGHNGAGKTTIMKMLSGYLEPDAGEILFDGVRVAADVARLQRSLGYLPENLPVYPELSVAAYLQYAARLKGLSGDDLRRAIRRAVEATELGDRFLSPIATLSRGLKQRVGVAQAILGSPSLLILDEPTNGLDPGQTERMRELIRRTGRSATVILSTHVMQEVEAVCDRVLILRAGRLVVDARLDELRRSRGIRLVTTATSERVARALARQPWSLDVEAGDAGRAGDDGPPRTMLVRVTAEAVVEDAIPDCVRALVDADVPVHAIQAAARDLQSLFLEVNSSALPDRAETGARELDRVA